jgi:glycosyltransferase involved in cell wall biosynthesis
MKFTLITSFYNGSEFIEQLYEKIKQQTYKNWEWVVTDDFSNDNGKEILINISNNDRRVRYVEQSKKKQMFWNPQDFCKDSDIIVQLDQDDYPLPKALEVYHHFFTKFPEVILITCAGNMYNLDGSWKCFYNLDYRKHNNMTCGQLTFLRAWRNNQNLKFDFNPNDWMKHFYNDLAIVCGIEEHGKVLNLPRNLYYYTHRNNSISHEHYSNIQEVREENNKLISSIIENRHSNDIDTIFRYFDPILDITHSFMVHSLNSSSEQTKLSFHIKNITAHQKNLLKELFFDYDININKLDGDEDFLVYVINSVDDFYEFLELEGKDGVKNLQLVIPSFWSIPEETRDDIISHIQKHYPVFWQTDEHMILTLLK